MDNGRGRSLGNTDRTANIRHRHRQPGWFGLVWFVSDGRFGSDGVMCYICEPCHLVEPSRGMLVQLAFGQICRLMC